MSNPINGLRNKQKNKDQPNPIFLFVPIYSATRKEIKTLTTTAII